MHTIERIQIVGFRGAAKEISIKFDREVNFIIGRNGTGKTSFINLLNGALSGDVPALRKASFKSISLKLRKSGSNIRPTLNFYREDDGGEIYYAVQPNASSKVEKVRIEAADPSASSSSASYFRIVSRQLGEAGLEDPKLQKVIRKYVSTTWLSVYRTAAAKLDEESRLFESPVDRRLHQVFRNFGTYFSTLDRLSATEADRFQTTYFLSLIAPPRLDALSSSGGSVDPEAERQALIEMFSEFGLQSSSYNSKLEAYVRRVKRAVSWRNGRKNEAIPAENFLTLTDALRVDELVSEWQDLLNRRNAIYMPKNSFVSIVNSLLYRKKLSISVGNEPAFENDAGIPLNPDSLSSGEKQLLILLGEALLQKNETFIYMADEPELSLHIDWQMKLVPSLRALNRSSQIIFATHSPDVVGTYGDKTIDLEKVLA